MEKGIKIDESDSDDEMIKILYTDSATSASYREASGSNIAEVESSLNASVHASASYMGFSAELEASYNQSQKTNDSYQFAWLDSIVTSFTGAVRGDIDDLSSQKVLTRSAYKAINNTNGSWSDFKKVVENYGTHVVVGGVLGGKIHVDMAADTSKIDKTYDVSAMIKAGYKNSFIDADGSVDAKYKNTLSQNSSAFTFSTAVTSGDSASKSAIAKMLSERSDDRGTAANWQASLAKAENCVLMEFSADDNLIPIYELVDTSREGGAKRKQDFEEYFNGKMKEDFTVTKQTKYVNSAPYKIDLSNLTWNDGGSFVKEVRYNSGTLVAYITSEYIPQLDSSKRVTVIYPATNNKVYYNIGYFPGNADHYPHSVSWDGSTPILYEKKDDAKRNADGKLIYGAVDALYTKSLNMSSKTPTYLEDTDITVFETDKNDLVLDAGTEGKYNLVKIFNYIYTRDYWKGTWARYIADGLSYFSVCPGGTMGVWCDGNELSFPPDNWSIPSDNTISKLLSIMNGIKGNLPDGMLSASFLKGGVLGLNLRSKTGYYYVDCANDNNPPSLRSSTQGYLGLVSNYFDSTFFHILLIDSSGAIKIDELSDLHAIIGLPIIVCQQCQ